MGRSLITPLFPKVSTVSIFLARFARKLHTLPLHATGLLRSLFLSRAYIERL